MSKSFKIILGLGVGCLALIGLSVVCVVSLAITQRFIITPTPRARVAAATHAATSIPTKIPTPIPTLRSAPPFQEIRSKIKLMTDAQWMRYTDELEGTWAINWTGWIDDVNEKTFGGYELWIDMDPPDAVLSIYDVRFDIPEELALKFHKDQKVTFLGRIKSVTNVLGACSIRLEEGSVK